MEDVNGIYHQYPFDKNDPIMYGYNVRWGCLRIGGTHSRSYYSEIASFYGIGGGDEYVRIPDDFDVYGDYLNDYKKDGDETKLFFHRIHNHYSAVSSPFTQDLLKGAFLLMNRNDALLVDLDVFDDDIARYIGIILTWYNIPALICGCDDSLIYATPQLLCFKEFPLDDVDICESPIISKYEARYDDGFLVDVFRHYPIKMFKSCFRLVRSEQNKN